jgi:hypothetical protein
MPKEIYLTSRMPSHEFETTEFWEPVCTICHEPEEHDVHHLPEGAEICGYDPCEYCVDNDVPGRGVPDYE